MKTLPVKNLENLKEGDTVSVTINGLTKQLCVAALSKTTISLYHPQVIVIEGVTNFYSTILTFTKTGKIAHWHKACGSDGFIKSVDILN